MAAPTASCRTGVSSGSTAGRGRCPYVHVPGPSVRRGVWSQSRRVGPVVGAYPGAGGTAGLPYGSAGPAGEGAAGPYPAGGGLVRAGGGPDGRGGGGAAGCGTGVARVPRGSCVPSESILTLPPDQPGPLCASVNVVPSHG